MEKIYKSKRFVDRLKWVIVDETGKVVNNNPGKDELQGLVVEPRKSFDIRRKYTKEQLLWYLIQFYEKYGRPPTVADFTNNSDYPSFMTYRNYFGSWSAALKLVGLDVDSMVKKGIIETRIQRGRFGEILIRDHFENNPTDLAGENCNSPCDGICPNGKIYDVKSSGLHENTHYLFNTINKYKEDIELYYLLGFNEDWTKLNYGWGIPGEIAEKDWFQVGFTKSYEYNIENMEEYNITGKLSDILRGVFYG